MSRAEDLFNKLCIEGQTALDELIVSRATEELFLDFKLSANDGSGKNFDETDRKNFSECVSGFGNSEGGVIVWGVECKQGADGSDVATKKRPLTDAQKFKGFLESAVSGCTIPPHPGVQNFVIPCQGTYGYVISHIPAALNAPLQTTKKSQYYIRAGSACVPTPHQVLAALFGRTPRARVKILWVYDKNITLQFKNNEFAFTYNPFLTLANNTSSPAKEPFTNVNIRMPGSNSEFAIITSANLSNNIWSIYKTFTGFSFVSNPPCKLVPDSQMGLCEFEVKFSPPYSKDFVLDMTTGSEGGELSRAKLTVPKQFFEAEQSFMDNNSQLFTRQKYIETYSSYVLRQITDYDPALPRP